MDLDFLKHRQRVMLEAMRLQEIAKQKVGMLHLTELFGKLGVRNLDNISWDSSIR